MLTAIKIGNFKAFAEAQRIPIRPLTLIYGANSSGKSSILHSLLFARHAQETGDLDVHRTNIGGDSVDFGGFRQFIHKRDVTRRMEWCAEMDSSAFTGHLGELLAPIKKLTVSIDMGFTLDDEGQPLRDLPEINAYEIFGELLTKDPTKKGDDSLLRMSKRRDGKLQLDRLEHEHPLFKKVLKAIIETATTTLKIKPSDTEGLDEAINAVVPEIIASVGKFLPEGLVKSEALSQTGGQLPLFPISIGRRKEDLAAAVRFFIPRTLDDLIRGINWAIIDDLTRLQYLGPLRSYPPRHLAFSQHHDPNWYAGGGFAWDVVRRDARVRKLVNEWLLAPDRLQTPYELVLRDLVGIDQLAVPLLDGLEELSEKGLDIEHEIDEDHTEYSYPIIKDPEAEVTKLQNLIRIFDSEKLNELILIDRRSNTAVSHRDVGIGISQVLPVLVGAYASKNQIIAIEQPEIHLHPALQADLGDVFIQSAFGENKNRFLIETHSEHLLLRIMRRIRETNNGELPKDIPPIRPEDVSILFVQPKDSASVVFELRLDNEGFLLDPWPGGFFEEGFRERFGKIEK